MEDPFSLDPPPFPDRTESKRVQTCCQHLTRPAAQSQARLRGPVEFMYWSRKPRPISRKCPGTHGVGVDWGGILRGNSGDL